jgi:hypothetical protein
MGGACKAQGRNKKCIQNFYCQDRKKIPCGRPSRKWEDNIRVDPRQVV